MKKLNPRLTLPSLLLLFILLALASRFSPANLLPSKPTGLQLNPRAADGSVSGNYQYSNGAGKETLQFSVSADGLATFRLENVPDTEALIVNSTHHQLPHLIWQGQDVDGLGILTSEEQAALDDALKGDLAHGLAMIPMDMACQGKDAVTPAQVAALLFPLQMRFKYQVTDRSALAGELAALTQCDYGLEEEGEPGLHPTVILMTPADPVPVVLGYFPFDEIGAVEPVTTGAGVLMASFDHGLRAEFSKIPSINPFGPDPIQNEWGPCEAKCRGACGSDCTHNNCSFHIDDRCEKNMDGENDGTASLVQVYECGTHPACIEHDACYDDCNRRHGCDTFAAAVCMHAGVLDPTTAMASLFSLNISCDRKVLNTYPYGDVEDWYLGYGHQPDMQTYEYHLKEYSYVRDPINCPRKGDEPVIDPEEAEEPIISPEEETEPMADVPEAPGPASQYEGETGWAMIYEPLEVREDHFVITVDHDGSVSGFLNFDYITPVDEHVLDDGDVCTTQYHFAATISISGQLVDNKGTVTADYVPTICEHIGTCSANIGCPGGQRQVFIEIINGKLEGRWIFDEYPDLTIPFTGTKQ